MTNAEKYLKENVDIEDILSDFGNMYADNELQKSVLMLGLKRFFDAPVKEEKTKPTLTEDEKVILKNLYDSDFHYKVIGRTKLDITGDCDLYIKGLNTEIINYFDHLFNFIKSGEEYNIEELLNE